MHPERKTGERAEDRLAWLALANGREQPILECLQALVDELGLRGEVVVHSLRVDLSRLGDLSDGDLVEAALDKQAQRGVSDQLPGASLLPLP
jgi:hypothetical protein